jgi:hypothetical protein
MFKYLKVKLSHIVRVSHVKIHIILVPAVYCNCTALLIMVFQVVAQCGLVRSHISEKHIT